MFYLFILQNVLFNVYYSVEVFLCCLVNLATLKDASPKYKRH